MPYPDDFDGYAFDQHFGCGSSELKGAELIDDILTKCRPLVLARKRMLDAAMELESLGVRHCMNEVNFATIDDIFDILYHYGYVADMPVDEIIDLIEREGWDEKSKR